MRPFGRHFEVLVEGFAEGRLAVRETAASGLNQQPPEGRGCGGDEGTITRLGIFGPRSGLRCRTFRFELCS
jgi:hypothetical protein